MITAVRCIEIGTAQCRYRRAAGARCKLVKWVLNTESSILVQHYSFRRAQWRHSMRSQSVTRVSLVKLGLRHQHIRIRGCLHLPMVAHFARRHTRFYIHTNYTVPPRLKSILHIDFWQSLRHLYKGNNILKSSSMLVRNTHITLPPPKKNNSKHQQNVIAGRWTRKHTHTTV